MRIAGRISEKNLHAEQSRPVTLAFLGDSVTHGCFEIFREGENGIDTRFCIHEAYHHKLKKLIEELFPRVCVGIIDAGINGDSAAGGLARVDRDVISYKPDLCVVCFGLNDVNAGIQNLNKYTEALEGIFSKLQAADIETIFMTPNMLGTRVLYEDSEFIRGILPSIITHQLNGDMDAYMDAARAVAQKMGVTVCDCYAKWKKLDSYGCDITHLLANHVNHPTENMHWLFAKSLLETMFEV